MLKTSPEVGIINLPVKTFPGPEPQAISYDGHCCRPFKDNPESIISIICFIVDSCPVLGVIIIVLS